MISRTTRSIVTFEFPFVIAGYLDELPAGNYEVIGEEDLLEGLSFTAYRRTATYLLINGQQGSGHMEMRPIEPDDMERALSVDHERSITIQK